MGARIEEIYSRTLVGWNDTQDCWDHTGSRPHPDIWRWVSLNHCLKCISWHFITWKGQSIVLGERSRLQSSRYVYSVYEDFLFAYMLHQCVSDLPIDNVVKLWILNPSVRGYQQNYFSPLWSGCQTDSERERERRACSSVGYQTSLMIVVWLYMIGGGNLSIRRWW